MNALVRLGVVLVVASTGCSNDSTAEGENAAAPDAAQTDAAQADAAQVDATGPDAAPPAPTWHQDVAPIVLTYCADCHSGIGIAPFPLRTADEVRRMGPSVVAAVESRTMPPWEAAPGRIAYRFDESLSDAQIATLQAWVAAGGPEGDPASAAPPLERERSALSRVDFKTGMAALYRPVGRPDDYRCFILDWPFEAERFVTGFAVQPGNPRMAHHASAYIFGPENAARVDQMDADDPEVGYACYGAPYVGSPINMQFLGAWAPGGAGFDFPEGTGIRVRPGSRMVLQMHYNVSESGPAPDRTELAFRLADSVADEAWILPWFDLDWVLRPDSMRIPAGATGVEHVFEGDPSNAAITRFVLPGLDLSRGLVLHQVAAHMHTRGVRIHAEVTRDDGTETPLLDIPRWDYDWQRTYTFAEPVSVSPGERLRMGCRWDNAAPDAIDRAWGEGSDDEMCAVTYFVTLPAAR
jgi:hypothetical protein